MLLIIGLGNPGKQYEKTRHNIGFWVINNLQICKFANFDPWQVKSRLKAEVSTGMIDAKKIILTKPQTFMNRSGEAAAAIAKFYKIKPENIWVIHDDLDLPLGKIKIQKDRSAAGHHGVQSIIDCLGTKDFVRFRIGIAPLKPTRQKGANFVLSNFAKNEMPLLNETLSQAEQAILEEILKLCEINRNQLSPYGI